MAKSLIELKTDLKSLKYQGVNGSDAPYVTKDIRNPESPSRAGQEIFRRVDDTVRVAKALSPTNSRFLENQAKLIQADNSQKLNPLRLNSDGTFLQRVANTALSVAGTAASTLAQVPLAGTGTRLGIAFRPTNGSVALAGSPIAAPSNLQDKGATSSILNSIPLDTLGARTTIDSLPKRSGVSKKLIGKEDVRVDSFTEVKTYTTVAGVPSSVPDRIALAQTGNRVAELNVDQKDEITTLLPQSKDILFPEGNKGRFPSGSAEVDTESPFRIIDYRTKVVYTPNIESRYKTGNQGHPKKPTSYKTTLDLAVDKLNQTDVRTTKLEGNEDPSDLIKFYFTLIAPGEEDTYLYFRAYLDSFSDSYQGSWSETQYIGRGEKMQTYDGFSRNISLSFKIAASTREEMRPLYRKIVNLASATAPTYGGGSFMRGTLARITVGDYLADTPGVITSVDYKWDPSYPWEIVLDKEEVQQQLPHILDCSITFRPIHDFIPETFSSPFITNTQVASSFLV